MTHFEDARHHPVEEGNMEFGGEQWLAVDDGGPLSDTRERCCHEGDIAETDSTGLLARFFDRLAGIAHGFISTSERVAFEVDD